MHILKKHLDHATDSSGLSPNTGEVGFSRQSDNACPVMGAKPGDGLLRYSNQGNESAASEDATLKAQNSKTLRIRRRPRPCSCRPHRSG